MRIALLLVLSLAACGNPVGPFCLHCEEPVDNPGYDPETVGPPRISEPSLFRFCGDAGCYLAPHGSAHYEIDRNEGGAMTVTARDPIVDVLVSGEVATVTALAPGDTELVFASENFPDEPFTTAISVAETIVDVRFVYPDYTTTGGPLAFLPGTTLGLEIDAARGDDVRRAIDVSVSFTNAQQTDWDTFVLPTALGRVAVEATGDSFGTRTLDTAVVDTADRMELSTTSNQTGTTVCFHSFAGAREVVTPAIYMAKLTNAGVTSTRAGLNCLRLTGSGETLVHAQALGQLVEQTLTLP
jgi:hypothetical protein